MSDPRERHPGPASLINVRPGVGKGLDEFAACVHVELGVDAGHVGLYSSLSDVELLADPLCRQTLSRERRDLALPVGKGSGTDEHGGRARPWLAGGGGGAQE